MWMPDHLDFFKDLEDVEHSFRRFAELVPADTGVVVADRDDQNTMETLAGLERPLITFGLEEGDVHAAGLEWVNGFPSFDIVFRGEKVTRVELQVPGEHNVRNALAAAAAALALRVRCGASGRGWAPSGERAAALSTRGHTGGRRSMTTTPTTLRSCGPC